jgi:Matrixin
VSLHTPFPSARRAVVDGGILIRAFVAVLLTALAIAFLSPNADGAPAADSDITIDVSKDTVRLGKRVTVAGEAPGLRPLVLQLRTRENGWQDLAAITTGAGGSYAFRAPGWRGTHRLRVVAPATSESAASVSDTRQVTVKMPYRPRGRTSDWTWLSHRGARWDPCRTITYRVNPRGSYPGAVADIRRTFRRVGLVTGFRFGYLGRTTRQIRRQRLGYHPIGTDIVIDWQTPKEEAGLSGRVAGIGGHWVQGDRRFDGYMLLDRTARLPRGTWRQVMTHEVGHVLGLGHAHSRRQLMYGVSSSLNKRLGAGDLAALTRVGASGGCLADRTQRAAPGTGPVPVDGA